MRQILLSPFAVLKLTGQNREETAFRRKHADEGAAAESVLGGMESGNLRYSWQSNSGGSPEPDHRTTGFAESSSMGVSCSLVTHPRVSWGGEIQSEQERTSKEKPNSSQMSKRLYSAGETQLLSCLLQRVPFLQAQQQQKACLLKGPQAWSSGAGLDTSGRWSELGLQLVSTYEADSSLHLSPSGRVQTLKL